MKKMTPALEIKEITSKYGNKIILDHFSLTIYAEEIISLLGPSGCGKTTLLKNIAGLENICNGKICISGSTVQTPSKSLPTRKRGLGMVFQDNALFPHLTVYENVVFGISKAEQKKSETQERIREILNILDILLLAEKYPHEISGGQQQRTSLARSIAPRPKLLLMDEPFTSQDVGLKAKIIDSVLYLLQKEKITTLIVTHDQNEAFKISHRVGVMQEYRLEQLGTPKEIYYLPTTYFTAGFIGIGSFVTAMYSQNQATNHWFSFKGNSPSNVKCHKGQEIKVHLRPEDVILNRRKEKKNTATGVIIGKEFQSGSYLYRIQIAYPNSSDQDHLVLYSLMPADFEKNIGDQVTAHVINKPYIFFPKV